MAFDPQDRQEIRLYLLGRLEPEPRSQRVEERMLTESDYYEELLAAEDELIDEYLSGALSTDERASFERHFLSTPERVRKLRFARSFGKYVAAARPARPSPAPARRTFASVLRPLFASPFRVAAVAVVLVVCSLLAWRAYVGSDAKVNEGLTALRQAYGDRRRPVEARISGWQYAPWSVTRGDERPDTDSVALDRAERLLRDAESERPGPASRHALGHFYLAQKKFDQAIRLLEEALGGDERNASLHNDLGVALLEKVRAERDGDASEKEIEDVARSAEHFNRAVALDDSLTEAYFNRALAYQELELRRQAEEGWREYLRRDANSPWADEARRNLKRLEESGHLAPAGGGDALKAFLDAARSGDDDAAWKVVSYDYTSAGNGVANRPLDSELGLASPGDAVGHDDALAALSLLARLERERGGDRHTSDLVGRYERATPKQRALLAEARGHAKAGYELFTGQRWGEAVGEYERARLAYERRHVKTTYLTIHLMRTTKVMVPEVPAGIEPVNCQPT